LINSWNRRGCVLTDPQFWRSHAAPTQMVGAGGSEGRASVLSRTALRIGYRSRLGWMSLLRNLPSTSRVRPLTQSRPKVHRSIKHNPSRAAYARKPSVDKNSTRSFSNSDDTERRSFAAARSAASLTYGSTRNPIIAVRFIRRAPLFGPRPRRCIVSTRKHRAGEAPAVTFCRQHC